MTIIMTNKDMNLDFSNLVQTQNLLDLELHELRAIFYPKLIHLMEIEKLEQDDQQINTTTKANETMQIKQQDNRKQTIDTIYNDERLIIENRNSFSRSLLDDRCIVGYIHQRLNAVDESDLNMMRNRFYKQIRFSGKNYLNKLFNALLEHSLSTGKTIIIDKNIKLERIGQNTNWKIDFTNFLTQNCKSSYEWLNHIRLGKLRQLDLLILRNHLNQQMIRERRSEINSRLEKEIQNHLNRDQQKKRVNLNKPQQDVQLVQNLDKFTTTNKKAFNHHTSSSSNKKSKKGSFINENVDYSIVHPETDAQLNLSEQKIQNVIIELSCLQSFRYANQFLDFRSDISQNQNQYLYRTDKEHTLSKTLQLTNKFEINLAKKSKMLNIDELRDILEEERMRNFDQDDSDEDEMTATMPNYRRKNKGKNRKWHYLKRYIMQNYRYVQMYCIRFLRRQTYNILIRYEEIKNQAIIIEQLNDFSQKLSATLPANVPYCQIGKSSLIAALKQFNWSHTQGPFIYNQNL